jgi:glycosyltransferase involved in cell wall biosynthesis
MRFLILTQYYPPETGAPQNRLSGLARELKQMGHEVVILTAMPNYPAMQIHPDYIGKKYVVDEFENIPVHRAWIYVSKNRSIISRLMNYFSFTFSSTYYASKIKGNFDYLMVESPPLFLGISAWWISKRKKAKMVFNVSDLWPESAEKLGVISNKMFLKLATILEEWLYKKSYMVTGQTQGIVQNIKTRFPNKKVHWLPNGVDESIFSFKKQENVRQQLKLSNDDFLIMYGGIIGLAQGLDVILDAAKLLPAESKITYLLLGDGPEKNRLQQRVVEENIARVKFLELVSREVVPSYVDAVDVAVIPLKKMDLFLGAIPSKIFENLALGKPLLLSVDGEARSLFIDQGNAGLFIEPENSKMLAEKSLKMEANPEMVREMGNNGKAFVQTYFMRKKITSDWVNTLN